MLATLCPCTINILPEVPATQLWRISDVAETGRGHFWHKPAHTGELMAGPLEIDATSTSKSIISMSDPATGPYTWETDASDETVNGVLRTL